LLEAMSQALDEVAARPDLRGLLICSSLPRHFMAGADLRLLAATDASGFATYLSSVRGVFDRLRALAPITVAVIDGAAAGGGVELALACDFRVATATATFSLPEIRLGLLPGAGGTQLLPELIGHQPARELMFSGRTVDAHEALALGLVDHRVTAAEAATVWAQRLLVGPPAAREAIDRCLACASAHGSEAGARLELAEIEALFARPETHSRIAAFFAKRAE
jgi:enoyl-CoA hydratase/carnithine racemase